MNNNNKFNETIMERGLYNHADNVMMYYDISKGVIATVFGDDDYDTCNLIELPCLHEFKGLAWHYFWKMLSNEERKIADNRTTRYLTFDYMYETGLVSVYEKALECATKQIYEDWANDYDVTIDWENIVID